MKGSLAAIAETVRVLVPVLDELGGELLVTAYGLHEGDGRAPMHAPLRGLLDRGCYGDGVIVAEGPRECVPVAGKGSLIFHLDIVRSDRNADHELRSTGANPIMAAHHLIATLTEQVARSPLEHPQLGRETFFVGAIHGGDLYNRVPVRVSVAGTRRYPPPRRWDHVVAEFEEVCRSVERRFDVEIDARFERSGQPFELSAQAPIIRALRKAHEHVVGAQLPLGNQLFSSDVNHFADAGIPAAAYGVDPARGHSTPEFVSLRELLLTSRVFLRASIEFLRAPGR
jgi:acetylornithine deacetylase/succinyl-diaminopimelate desuccinylase-like protein